MPPAARRVLQLLDQLLAGLSARQPLEELASLQLAAIELCELAEEVKGHPDPRWLGKLATLAGRLGELDRELTNSVVLLELPAVHLILDIACRTIQASSQLARSLGEQLQRGEAFRLVGNSVALVLHGGRWLLEWRMRQLRGRAAAGGQAPAPPPPPLGQPVPLPPAIDPYVLCEPARLQLTAVWASVRVLGTSADEGDNLLVAWARSGGRPSEILPWLTAAADTLLSAWDEGGRGSRLACTSQMFQPSILLLRSNPWLAPSLSLAANVESRQLTCVMCTLSSPVGISPFADRKSVV